MLTAYIERQFALSPLELIAKTCLDLKVSDATVHAIFDNYDRFLAILDDPGMRNLLAAARTHSDLRDSIVWNEIRKISKPFHDGLVALFLNEDDKLKQLTMTYGVF